MLKIAGEKPGEKAFGEICENDKRDAEDSDGPPPCVARKRNRAGSWDIHVATRMIRYRRPTARSIRLGCTDSTAARAGAGATRL
ncbi:MAG: hypothetical protein ACREQ1_04310, partial [Woeseiaceae bacterium]